MLMYGVTAPAVDRGAVRAAFSSRGCDLTYAHTSAGHHLDYMVTTVDVAKKSSLP